jgi:DNA processing protein
MVKLEMRDVLIALHETENIGWQTIRLIVERVGDLSEALEFTVDDWLAIGLQSGKAYKVCASLKSGNIEEKIERNRRAGIEVYTMFDEGYPELLRHIPMPPWVLYAKGSMQLCGRLCVAMVGTRTPTVYGSRTAESLAHDLSERGFCVVSGLARGIDTYAHVGALKGSGGTIGVLGCGIDRIYPPENGRLFQTIEEKGLLLSEYHPGMKSHPGLFPLRNRIIAGLSLGVVVVEAAKRSGSLITVDHALDASRDVFAVPGPITSPKSEGTLELIKKGAKMATCSEDIWEDYKHRMAVPQLSSQHDKFNRSPTSPDQQKILSYLSAEPVSFDLLLERSQFTFGHLHSVLLSLLLTKRIAQLPGSSYIII